MTNRLRILLRIDAAYEAVLALVLLLLLGNPSLPGWLGSPIVIAIAVVLLAVAIVLWFLSPRPAADIVRLIAICNGVTAVVIAVWAIVGLGAGAEFRTILAIAAVLLAFLAGAQYLFSRNA